MEDECECGGGAVESAMLMALGCRLGRVSWFGDEPRSSVSPASSMSLTS